MAAGYHGAALCGRDAYSDGYVLVLFRRDAVGRVIGFDASTPRLLGVAFTRER